MHFYSSARIGSARDYTRRLVSYHRWLWIFVGFILVNFALMLGLQQYQRHLQDNLQDLENITRRANENLSIGIFELLTDNGVSDEAGMEKGLAFIQKAREHYATIYDRIQVEKLAPSVWIDLQNLLASLDNFTLHRGSDSFTAMQAIYGFNHLSGKIRRDLSDALKQRQQFYQIVFNIVLICSASMVLASTLLFFRAERLAMQAANAVQESEDQFRQLTQHISDVLWLKDVNSNRLLFISPSFEQIWGIPIQEIYANPELWLDSTHPADKSRVMALFGESLHRRVDAEYRILNRSGHTIWIHGLTFPIKDVSGRTVRVAGIARDITVKRQDQEMLYLLKTAVARLNDIVMISEVGTRPGDNAKVVFVNPAFEKITGYRADEILGKTPAILQGPKTDNRVIENIKRRLNAWQPASGEVINYHKNGGEIRLELDIIPLENEAGQFTHWVAVERDVSEKHALEAQLQQASRMEAIGQLTGGISHDFNNLLTVIWGNADLLSSKLTASDPLHGLATMIGVAAERGAKLTQQLLAFSRKQSLMPELTSVNSLLSQTAPLLQRAVGEHIRLQICYLSQDHSVLVDQGQLENAILNLCINSRDAMGVDGKLMISVTESQLTVPGCEPGPYIRITVEDSGMGIPEEILPKVFEPLFTTKVRGKGTGLGLSMVFGFIKQSGGHIEIDSEPGVGTKVHLYLKMEHKSSI